MGEPKPWWEQPRVRIYVRRDPPGERWRFWRSYNEHELPMYDAELTYTALLDRLRHQHDLDRWLRIDVLIHPAMTDAELEEAFEQAMWDGDVELLDRLAPCGCCCHEHTFDDCPARRWHGCRGSGYIDVESWVRHYAQHHGMTREQFFG
jgi:hypothetical protein